MILKKIALAALISFALLNCSPSRTQEVKHLTVANEENLDEKMTLWFLAFNYYQSKGYDMETADRMAIEAVEKEAKTISLETLAVNPETDLN